MGLSFFTGSFTSRTSVGTDVITGVGFTPKVIIIYSGGYDVAFNTITGYIEWCLGAAVDTTAANQRAIYVEAVDGSGNSNTYSRWHSSAVTIPDVAASIGAISAIGADGFTVNWTVEEALANRLGFLCIGGTDITNTKIGDITSPTAGTTGNQAITGVGFQPDVVILFSCGGTTSNVNRDGAVYGLGFATSSTNQVCTATVSKDAVATKSTKRYQRGDNTACFALIDNVTTTSKALEGSFVSMDSDGFTINWTTVAAAGASKIISYIAINGGSYKCGAITAPVSGTAPVSQATTGVGFQPTGLIMASACGTASSSIGANNKMCFGSGSSSTTRGCAFSGDNDATANDITMAVNKNAKIITNYTIVGAEGSSTINAEADLTSLDADGFTLSWTTRDTNAYESIYLAAGANSAAGKTLYIAKGYFKADG